MLLVLMALPCLQWGCKLSVEALGMVEVSVPWSGGKSGIPTTHRAEQGTGADRQQRPLRSRRWRRLTASVRRRRRGEKTRRVCRGQSVQCLYRGAGSVIEVMLIDTGVAVTR